MTVNGSDIASYFTPCKLGRPVLTGSGEPGAFDEMAVDSPFVFHHQGLYHMMYIGFNGTGYQTALAVSEDLIHWTFKGLILKRGEGSGWDSKNVAGTWMLKEDRIEAVPILKKWRGKYWLVYHSYPEDGYEEGPGRIGLAWSEDESLMEWNRLPDPILVPEDGGEWERGGLYKECLVEKDGTFYLFYNAKNKPEDGSLWIEQTGCATSRDLHHWTRHEGNPVLKVSPSGWDRQFVSDPCVLRDGDRWIMFYFGLGEQHAQEGIALSDDLLAWEKYEEPIVRVGQLGELDASHAHKPSVVMHNGILYHFYCACRPSMPGDPTRNIGDEFRTIAVATSKPL